MAGERKASCSKSPSQSPTALTLAEMRRRGCIADVTERFITGANIRKDLFGFVDVVAISETGETIGIQATTRAHVAHRISKINEASALPCLRRANWRLLVHGWDVHDGRVRLDERDLS